jgi:hypothetical protein
MIVAKHGGVLVALERKARQRQLVVLAVSPGVSACTFNGSVS